MDTRQLSPFHPPLGRRCIAANAGREAMFDAPLASARRDPTVLSVARGGPSNFRDFFFSDLWPLVIQQLTSPEKREWALMMGAKRQWWYVLKRLV